MNILGIGPMELLLILIIALIVFGPERLPEIGAGLGRAIREFRAMSQALTEEFTQELTAVTELTELGEPEEKQPSSASPPEEPDDSPSPSTPQPLPTTSKDEEQDASTTTE